MQTKEREQGEHMMSKGQERWQRSDPAGGLVEPRRRRIKHIDVSGRFLCCSIDREGTNA